MGRACVTYSGKRNIYRILVGKSEGTRPLVEPRHKWEDNIKMYVKEIDWDGMDWINMVQDRDKCWHVVNMVVNLQVAQNASSVTNQGTISCSRQKLC
jgi:hypothetical protein